MNFVSSVLVLYFMFFSHAPAASNINAGYTRPQIWLLKGLGYLKEIFLLSYFNVHVVTVIWVTRIVYIVYKTLLVLTQIDEDLLLVCFSLIYLSLVFACSTYTGTVGTHLKAPYRAIVIMPFLIHVRKEDIKVWIFIPKYWMHHSKHAICRYCTFKSYLNMLNMLKSERS